MSFNFKFFAIPLIFCLSSSLHLSSCEKLKTTYENQKSIPTTILSVFKDSYDIWRYVLSAQKRNSPLILSSLTLSNNGIQAFFTTEDLKFHYSINDVYLSAKLNSIFGNSNAPRQVIMEKFSKDKVRITINWATNFRWDLPIYAVNPFKELKY